MAHAQKMCNHDMRRALSTMLNALESGGNSLGPPRQSSPREIQNYLARVSSPLLDRIDLHIEVPPVKFREITSERTGEMSSQIRERVVAARKRQQARFKDKPKITCNARTSVI
jgi:predicted ATPase with chaperone activity